MFIIKSLRLGFFSIINAINNEQFPELNGLLFMQSIGYSQAHDRISQFRASTWLLSLSKTCYFVVYSCPKSHYNLTTLEKPDILCLTDSGFPLYFTELAPDAVNSSSLVTLSSTSLAPDIVNEAFSVIKLNAPK